jgi:hypothetical protein
MAVDAPSGLPIVWFPVSSTGKKVWGILKARLTGKKSEFGHFFSEVNLSDADADKLIKNIKKDPRGYPDLDEGKPGADQDVYQNWLVETYLGKTESISDKLDDLLDDIRSEKPEPPTSSAIVPVTKKPSDLVEEEIDPQILAILGLQDVFDLTYEEYSSLLKEASIRERMSGSQMTTENIELITDEYKRVKGKTGAFKVKQKKISIDKVMNRRAPSSQRVQLDPKKLLPPGIEATTPKKDLSNKIVKFLNEDFVDGLGSINDKLDELLNSIRSEDAAEKKEKEKKRRKSEVDKKKKREVELEGGKKANAVFDKVSKPFVSFFDRIKQFFLSILLGSALNFLLSVFKNPGIILNPLKSLANSIVEFLNNIVSFLWNFFVSPINFVINSINSGVSGLIGQINNAIGLIPGTNPINAPQIPTIPGPPQIPTPFPVQQQEGGGSVINVGDISFMSGGKITNKSGIKVGGFGKDDRLIAAQEGEVMMSNKAGDFWGRDTLLSMNAMAGGTNKPKIGKMGISAMQGGGRVGTLFPHMDAQTSTYSGGSHVIGQGEFANVLASILSQSAQKNKINRLPGSGSSAVNRDLKSLKTATSSGSPSALAEFSTLKQAVDRHKTPSGFANSNYMSDFIRGLKSTLNGAPLIIGMDHSRRMISNSSSDPRTTQAAATGASYGGYTERDFTDAIAQRIQREIVNTKIIKPEDYKNYEQYDKALKNAINSAKLGTKPPPAPILPPAAKGGIIPLPIPIGGGPSQNSIPKSSAAPNQGKVPSFSSEDPNNITTLVVKAIYNVVG